MSKVVLITGASSGIGQSIAELLTKRSYKVYGTSRRPEHPEKYPFKLIALDVTDTDSIKKAVSHVISGEGRLDVLINNAGMGITGAIEDTPTEKMREVFDTNLFGAIDMIKAVLPQMRNQQSGLIINITSLAGYMGLPFRGVYSATKGAFELITEAARMEIRKFGIEMTNIAPGDIATNIAAGRYHTPVFEDSPYKEDYQRNLDMMNEHVEKGKSPDKVAEKVYHIIDTKHPRIHYKVSGFLEKFSVVLKRTLPNRVYERMLMRYYKM